MVLIHVVELRRIGIHFILQVLLLVDGDQQVIGVLEALFLFHFQLAFGTQVLIYFSK